MEIKLELIMSSSPPHNAGSIISIIIIFHVAGSVIMSSKCYVIVKSLHCFIDIFKYDARKHRR